MLSGFPAARVARSASAAAVSASDVPGDGCAQAEQRHGSGPASSVEQRIGGRPINSDSSPATLAVKYLRIWSYR